MMRSSQVTVDPGPRPSEATRRWISWAIVFAALAICLIPSVAFAGGEKATSLNAVADTRDMGPGLSKFLADTYNGNLYLYALYVVVIMAGMGAFLGWIVDKLVALTGIDLGRMDHHE